MANIRGNGAIKKRLPFRKVKQKPMHVLRALAEKAPENPSAERRKLVGDLVGRYLGVERQIEQLYEQSDSVAREIVMNWGAGPLVYENVVYFPAMRTQCFLELRVSRGRFHQGFLLKRRVP